MKKTEVKEFEIVKDEYGQSIYPIDYSLSMIANMLSAFEHGTSRLAIDNNSEEVYLDGVEARLESLNDKVDELIGAVNDISNELQSLSTISNTLENMLQFYIEFNQTKKTK